MNSGLVPVFVAPPSRQYLFNASPVFGLFYDDEQPNHPLMLGQFCSVVPIVFSSSRRRQKKPAIYTFPPSSTTETALGVDLKHSGVPQPLPQEFWDFLSSQGISLNNKPVNPSDIPENCVPVGFGPIAEMFYGDGMNPFPNIIEAYHFFMIPYKQPVVKYLSQPVSDDLDYVACDFGWSYVAPPEDLYRLYRAFEQEPSIREFCQFVYRLYPSTPAYAEQVSRIAVAVSRIAAATGETRERRVGAGYLLIGKRLIPFPLAYSENGRAVEWNDLHEISKREMPEPYLQIPAVVEVERAIHLNFYYCSYFTLPRRNPQRVLAFVLLDKGGVWEYAVLDIPSYLTIMFGRQALVSLTRLSVNTRAAKMGGAEEWQVDINEGIEFIEPHRAEEILAYLVAIEQRSVPRPFTRWK